MDNNDLKMDSTSVPVELAEGSPENHEDLLAETKAQWMFGDWVSLSCRSLKDIANDPNRAKVALLIASAHLQCGNQIQAEAATKLAIQWGCSPKAVSRILMSGVYNSLARISALDDNPEAMSAHFQEALSIAGGKSAQLAANSRMLSELKHLGLKNIENYSLEAGDTDGEKRDSESTGRPFQVINASAHVNSTEERFNGECYDYYKSKGSPQSQAPFLLIDSKSLPRSGLHYLKSVMGKVLGKRFSFCEWYQEVGCCRSMPCALTSFSQRAEEDQAPRFRLIKSHDFELNDPDFPPAGAIRRVVLYRDSVFQLTSWFLLDQLGRFKGYLRQKGIPVEQVFLRHEPDLANTAYEALDDVFQAPGKDELAEWLEAKKNYMKGFIDKWISKESKSRAGSDVIHYREINDYVLSVLKPFENQFEKDVRERFLQLEEDVDQSFTPRSDPYQLKSDKVSTFVQENRQLFEMYAKDLDHYMKTAL